jgi:UDP-glucose 4-epimerase
MCGVRSFVIGGAGFIGSHVVDLLVRRGAVTVFDNLSTGKVHFIQEHLTSGEVVLVRGDCGDLPALAGAMRGHDVVLHFAANPEARLGLVDTRLDLEQGTIATYNALEAARLGGVGRFLFASSGTVYGNVADACGELDLGRMPISFYGASKLAGESLLGAYAECFGITGYICRFGNVVGPRSTHGVILDFCRKLKSHPEYLDVLGDGDQSKPYLHVTDCAKGILHVLEHSRLDNPAIYNISPGDVTTVRQIAELVVAASPHKGARIELGDTPQGWAGDVPRSRMKPDKLTALGFSVGHGSNEAVRVAVNEVVREVFRA